MKKKYDVTEEVEGAEDLTDAMVGDENPGSGIPITEGKAKGGKVNKAELKRKLKRGYI